MRSKRLYIADLSVASAFIALFIFAILTGYHFRHESAGIATLRSRSCKYPDDQEDAVNLVMKARLSAKLFI